MELPTHHKILDLLNKILFLLEKNNLTFWPQYKYLQEQKKALINSEQEKAKILIYKKLYSIMSGMGSLDDINLKTDDDLYRKALDELFAILKNKL
jgi:hypothetical protein